MIGRSVLHYEIVETLGRGGMGVVYKARDTHLDRFVAIKVLPPEKVADPEKKRRFVQEAKAASALNHPNIIHIYDIAEADKIPFIAMEYVPGKTLDQMIGRRGMPLDKTLKYAAQIADALSRAHMAGIIHRDLKPSNVIVTDDGLVKVLDFGLAKLAEPVSGELGETAPMPANDKPNTAEGTILGTVAYMSPEQAEGKPVDARSDLFAFGSLLYEMITGQRAFPGDSALSILSAILKEEPRPISAVAAATPHELERIVTRCLRKDPARRFQHADDLKIALMELEDESDSGALSAHAGTPQRLQKSLLVRISAAVAGVALATALGVWLWHPARKTRSIPNAVPLTSYPGSEITPSFSPDGNQVAFAWNAADNQPNFNIYVQLLGGSEPVRLTHNPADDLSPAWSPDGRYIAFLRMLSPGRAGVFLIPPIGGRERKLSDLRLDAEGLSAYRGLSWFPDSKWLAVTDKTSPGEPSALFVLSVESGEKRRLTSPPQWITGDQTPAVSPDGRAVVFIRSIAKNIGDLFLLQLSEDLIPQAEPRRLTMDNRFSAYPAWAPDGGAIVFNSGSRHTGGLWAIQLSRFGSSSTTPERLTFTGDEAWQPAISRQGHMAYAQFSVDVDIWKLELDGDHSARTPPADFISSTRIDHEPRYSPDGKHVVFCSNRSGTFEIWVGNSDGSNVAQLTSFASPYYVSAPLWSPDGELIYFHYNPGGKKGLYVISAGGGRPKRADLDDLDGFSRDGTWIYFTSSRSGEDQIWKKPAKGGQAIQVTKTGGSGAVESPDGRYLYYLKGRAGGKVSLWRLPAGGGDELQVLESVINNNFAIVDRGVYFISDAQPFSVQFRPFDSGKAVMVSRITREPAYGFSVSPDGRTLLFTGYEPARSDLMLVENYR